MSSTSGRRAAISSLSRKPAKYSITVLHSLFRTQLSRPAPQAFIRISRWPDLHSSRDNRFQSFSLARHKRYDKVDDLFDVIHAMSRPSTGVALPAPLSDVAGARMIISSGVDVLIDNLLRFTPRCYLIVSPEPQDDGKIARSWSA